MSQVPMTDDAAEDVRIETGGHIALGMLRLMLFACVAGLVFTLGRVAWIAAGF